MPADPAHAAALFDEIVAMAAGDTDRAERARARLAADEANLTPGDPPTALVDYFTLARWTIAFRTLLGGDLDTELELSVGEHVATTWPEAAAREAEHLAQVTLHAIAEAEPGQPIPHDVGTRYATASETLAACALDIMTAAAATVFRLWWAHTNPGRDYPSTAAVNELAQSTDLAALTAPAQEHTDR